MHLSYFRGGGILGATDRVAREEQKAENNYILWKNIMEQYRKTPWKCTSL